MHFKFKKLLPLIITAALFTSAAFSQIRPIGGGIQRIDSNKPASAKPDKTQNTGLSTSKTEVPNVSAPVLGPSSQDKVVQIPAQPAREWVVMVYINAKNNLDPAGVMDVLEMEEIGSTDKAAFVVEIGRMEEFANQSKEYYQLDYWTGGRRYFITQNKTAVTADGLKRISSPVIFKQSSDMGDIKNVVAFAKWTKQKFPAKKYALIMWNHGSGFGDPHPRIQHIGNKSKGISFDDKTGNYIRTTEITQMLKDIGGVDVFATDACLMQMIEVAYHARTYSKFIVGAEELQPGYGYDYTLIAQALNQGSLTPRDLSIAIVETSAYHYGLKDYGFKQELTQSSIESSKLPALITELNTWTQVLMSEPAAEIKPALIIAKDKVMRFQEGMGDDYSNYGDLGMFVSLFGQNTKNIKAKQASQKLLLAIKNAVVTVEGIGVHAKTNLPYRNASGIAIGLPSVKKPYGGSFEGDYEISYFEYPFVKKTNWGNFYKWMCELVY